jgi:hypothetical protein
MKNDRIGDWLWEEWDGEDLNTESDLVYFTYEWVDLDNEIVKRALSSCLQRDGVAESLSDGFKMAEGSLVTTTYAGHVGGSKLLTVCNEDGETVFGDLVDKNTKITLIEI